MSARLAFACFAIIAIVFASAAQDVVPPPVKKEAAKKEPAKKTVEVPQDPIKAAQKVLQDAKIGTDPKALINFFESRTLTDENRAKLLSTIHQLGDDNFDLREQASENLTNAGLAALPILRAATRNADIEIIRRVEICLQAINLDQETARIIAAATMLAQQKADGTVRTLLAYLPCVPDDEMIADGLRKALVSYVKAMGQVDPLLMKALDDKDVVRRAMAVQVIAEAMPSERAAVRKLLSDPEPKVRYLAASALAKAGDEDALPTLLKLIADGPMEVAFQVEDMLCQLLDVDEKPPATLGDGDRASREKAFDAWKKWTDDHKKAKNLRLARLNEAEPLRGLTLIVEVDGAAKGGRIWECGPDGKQRWEITNLGGPVDVQVLPGGRLLIPEYYTSRVTERDREGKILWESPKLAHNTVGAQRLPNGNTLIATMGGVVEYTRTNQKVAEFNNNAGSVFQAFRHRNGHTYILAGQAIVEYGTDNKPMRTINIGTPAGWGGFEILPNGNFLVAFYGQGNKYAEVDKNGKILWEHSTMLNPTRAQRLRNGNTLVAGGNVMFVIEYDRDRKEIWKVATKGAAI